MLLRLVAIILVLGCARSAVAVQPRVDDSAALLQLDSTEMEVAAPAVAAGAAAAAAATPAAPIEECPKNCNGQGVCLAAKCGCYPGFTGEDCSKRVCEKGCNGHGKCTDGVCECEPGYAGIDCSFRGCKNACNNNGYCDTYAGECICFPGFSGADCSVLPPVGSAFHSAAPIVRGKKCSRDCSGHGLCDDGTCWCEDKWTGTDCSQMVCLNQCSGHGECDGRTGQCTCRKGWWGADCSGKPCPNDCSGHGQCQKSGLCMCAPGFYGLDCSPKNCMNDCSGHGTCTWDESVGAVCHCADGWIGADCSQVRCANDCSGHGKCMPGGQCACDAGYFGFDCSPLNCANDCGKHGTCLVPPGKERGECMCAPGYGGPLCQDKVHICPKSCSGHGTCDESTGLCRCEPGYLAPACAPIRCHRDCSGHGTCLINTHTGQAKCKCDETRTGSYCQKLNLEGTRQEVVRATEHTQASAPVQRACAHPTCNGHGQCDTKTGLCHCDAGFHGLDCALQNCPNDCSGHGTCLFPDPLTHTARCHCKPGWRGDDCSTKTCVECGFAYARGRCNEKTLTCECVEGWTGAHCHKRACPNNCNLHGKCVKGKCVCNDDFEGADCSEPRVCENDCSGKGVCHKGRCLCNEGWHGRACTIPGVRAPREGHGSKPAAAAPQKSECEPKCSEHGRCLSFIDDEGVQDFACHCENGWVGATCALRDGPNFQRPAADAH